jgi:hypothetical protein
MLGHPTSAKAVVIVTMTAEKLMNHGLLAGKHPGASCGTYTIVGRGECLKIPAS